MTDELPVFDPASKCVKCGWEIPEPQAPTKAGPDGTLIVVGLAPQRQPPTVEYCNGAGCPWDLEHQGTDEHLHQFCVTCGFEWLSKPLG